VTSVSQIETMTGYRFFTALPANIVQALKNKVDGQTATVMAQGDALAQPRRADDSVGQPLLVPIGIIVLTMLLVLTVGVLVVFYKKAKQNR
jgi:hypothetical protein